MRRVVLLLAVACFGFTGCANYQHQNACRTCGPSGWKAARRVQKQADFVPKIPCNFYQQVGPAGPPSASYAYPYYTTRAPRDFLVNNPPTIGN
jgi:hypothetical protein